MIDSLEPPVAGASRLPRLASSPRGQMSLLPVPSHGPLSSSDLANKRKASTSPSQLVKPKPSLSALSAAGDAKHPAGAGFKPTSRKASATTTRSVSAGSTSHVEGNPAPVDSRPATRMITRPASTIPPPTRNRTAGTVPRPVRAVAGTSTAAPGARRPLAATATATTSRVGMSRSAGPSGRPGLGGASKSSGSAPPLPDNGRLDKMEQMIKAMYEKEQKNISSQQVSKEDFQSLLKSIHDPDKHARKDLAAASEEVANLTAKHAREMEDLETQLRKKDRDKRNLEDELREVSEKLVEERENVRQLKRTLAEQSTQHMTLNAQLAASQAQGSALQAEIERTTMQVSAMRAEVEVSLQKVREADERAAAGIRAAEEAADERISEIEEELREAETIRRKLHNQVQELKGNIRVFARLRPVLPHEGDADNVADIAFSDERTDQETGQSQIIITNKSESAMGREREQVNQFTFDKVFQPKAGQKQVFEEISMLAQSVLDGYNVCIFAYGQTGSGKSWTMEGGLSDEDVGMIPRAIDMIFRVSSHLKDRGWRYQMEGQFLEVYNEVINDLLGTGQFDTKKHEIKHDKDGKMSVTDAVCVPLTNARQVSTLLERARSRRAVAATLMNERSSRSHSVFTLKVKGYNPLTEEKCEAMLNLVDLAGSERLASSGAGENKDRLRETININKSLSALADVIGALGQGQQGGHVPYRNSTLTRLLQTSLSGSSKTLMLCNLSPLQAHLGETLCSLRFATKVNSTVVGKVQKQVVK